MSWKEDTWSQDDIINNGYPFVTDPGIAEKYAHSSVKSIWTIQEDENNGYPVITDPGTAEKYDYTSVKSIWKFRSNVNQGFPHIVSMEEEPKIFVGTIRAKCVFLGSKKVKISAFKAE